MAKNKTSDTFANSDPANYQPGEKKYNVLYRFNGSFELYVGPQILKFVAHKMNPVYPPAYANGVPASIVNSPDFQTQKKYFSISEIIGG